MGNSEGKQLPEVDLKQMTNKNNQKVKKVAQQPVSKIVQSTQQTSYKLPEDLHNREKVRECINKYNDKIQLEMKKQYVQDFFSMRQKLLKNMENICRQDYPVPKGKVGKQFKECIQSVQTLISEQDQRMQEEFGMKLFLLADKCLMKEENLLERQKSIKKQYKPSGNPVDKCVDKLVKYRNLNMEMHILKLQLARQLL